MSRYHAYISTAIKIIEGFNGREPFSAWLKTFFSSYKKAGSTDRRIITSLCYGYLRVAHAFKNLSKEEVIIAGSFITHADERFLSEVRPELAAQFKLTAIEKFRFFEKDVKEIFPLDGLLSKSIDAEKFCLSLLSQPDTFLRARPGKKNMVTSILDKAGIGWVLENGNAIRLPPDTKLGELIRLNRDAVIQDLNSQRTLAHLNSLSVSKRNLPVKVWDCCAASGGKSILIYDLLNGHVQLFLSDKREKILVALAERLREAGIVAEKIFRADLLAYTATEKYDVVICDAPCSGSGTWARTPEQLYFFDEKKLNEYAQLQIQIVERTVSALAEGGIFVYITCSVFEKENEQVVKKIQYLGLRQLHQEYLCGYEQKADTLFAAVFSR